MTKITPGDADELVIANHILAAQGVVDAFGHVSLRGPEAGSFLLARSMAPSMVQRDDIFAFDLDGALIGSADVKPYLERFIHSEIYRARPDVGAIVHSHSPAVIPFGVTPAPLRPIFHMSAFLCDAVPTFDIRDSAGDTDMLIRNARLGAALSTCLGNSCAVLQRGHGSTVIGRTLREAVFRAVYLEVNARLQAAATPLGPITFLSAGEAALAAEAVGNQVDRAWDMWALALEPKK